MLERIITFIGIVCFLVFAFIYSSFAHFFEITTSVAKRFVYGLFKIDPRGE